MIHRLFDYPMCALQFNHRKKSGVSSFGSLMSDTQRTSATPTIHLYLPNENTVYSGGKGEQTVYAEYTSDSTAIDPVVRIRGQSSSGEYDFICHINEIDPEWASYAELCALYGHLQKTGNFTASTGGYSNAIPVGIEVGDLTQKQNYMSKISEITTSQMFSQSIRDKDLLKLYRVAALGRW